MQSPPVDFSAVAAEAVTGLSVGAMTHIPITDICDEANTTHLSMPVEGHIAKAMTPVPIFADTNEPGTEVMTPIINKLALNLAHNTSSEKDGVSPFDTKFQLSL
jgi:hypothetical protein